MIADELRRQADVFIDLAELQSRIGRDLSEPPPPRDGTERLRRGRIPKFSSEEHRSELS